MQATNKQPVKKVEP
jgi:Ulp1 family protease